MRAAPLLAVVLLVPLTGCVTNLPLDRPLTMFALAPIERGDPAPLPVEDCEELLTILKERARTEALVALDQSVEGMGYGYAVAMEDMGMAEGAPQAAAASGPPGDSGGSAGKAQVTGTNNQEAGVDEGDIIKTDGEWTYVLHGDTLRILHSRDVGDVDLYSTKEFGSGAYAQGVLLLEARDPYDGMDDRLVVVRSGASPAAEPHLVLPAPARERLSSGFTHILVLSLEDRLRPETIHEEWIEGESAGARLVDGVAHIVVHRRAQDLGLIRHAMPTEEDLEARRIEAQEFHTLSEADQKAVRAEVAVKAALQNEQILAEADLAGQVPLRLERQYDLLLPQSIEGEDCQGIFTTPDTTGRGFTTIASMDITADVVERRSIEVVGGDPIVYASKDAIVLASPSQDTWWYWAQPELEEMTDVQWFQLDGLDVAPIASGRVLGIVQNSFALDEHDGALRVVSATGTYNRGWLPETSLQTMVTVFDATAGLLVPRGAVAGIAPGERLWSVRFTDERAYLVTFDAMDPLFVIDLAGPVPEVLGELKVAGVSTYIHPLGDERLLTIGYGGGDDGLGLDESRILVSLFDVEDPEEPQQLDVLDLSPPGGGSHSGALHEHKAFTYWHAIGTLAVPVSSYGTGRYGSEAHVGLDLIDVDANRGTLSLRGLASQDAFGDSRGYGAEVQRSYFLGDPNGAVSVYALSTLGITAHDFGTLRLQDSVAFS